MHAQGIGLGGGTAHFLARNKTGTLSGFALSADLKENALEDLPFLIATGTDASNYYGEILKRFWAARLSCGI